LGVGFGRLEGSVRKVGNRVRVTAQLIDAISGVHVWADRYDRDLDDIFAVQDEITANVAAIIEPALGDAEQQRVLRKPPERLDAWEAYQHGLWHLYKYGADGSFGFQSPGDYATFNSNQTPDGTELRGAAKFG
jgi:hypothetical protein